MTTYKEFLARADDHRNRWHLRRAIRNYKLAFSQASDATQRAHCCHMLGVTYKQWGKYRQAALSLHAVASWTEDKRVLANVNRDLGDVYSLQGRFDQAIFANASAQAVLTSTTPEHFVTIGFHARILQRMGYPCASVIRFEKADSGLTGELKLFNMVPYLNALSLCGNNLQFRIKLREAEALCRQHGAWKHRLELWALRTGGYRRHNLILRLVPLRRYLPF